MNRDRAGGARAAARGPVVVACAADDRFSIPLAVMVRSLLDNLGQHRELLLFVIDGGITAAHKQKVLNSWDHRGAQVTWLEPAHSLVERLRIRNRVGRAASLRLLIPDLLPGNLKRVIYLDCDLLVLRDIGKLWEADLQGRCLGAVGDMGMPTVARGLLNYRRLGIPPESKYFNSGVLSMDLGRFRAEKISEKVIDYFHRHPASIRWPDQDGLNAVLPGRWFELDPRWNACLESLGYRSWRETPYSRKTWETLVHRPYILHFASAHKPWHAGCDHPRKGLFFEYLDRTRWAGWRPKARKVRVRPLPPGSDS